MKEGRCGKDRERKKETLEGVISASLDANQGNLINRPHKF